MYIYGLIVVGIVLVYVIYTQHRTINKLNKVIVENKAKITSLTDQKIQLEHLAQRAELDINTAVINRLRQMNEEVYNDWERYERPNFLSGIDARALHVNPFMMNLWQGM